MQESAFHRRGSDKKAQLTLFIILGLVIVIFVALALYVANRPTVQVVERTPILKTDCEDGTKNGACSEKQPLICKNGALKPACSECGCVLNQLCQADGQCKGSAEQATTNFSVFIIPINYAITDKDFLRRVELIKSGLFSTTMLGDANIIVVDEPLTTTEDCLTITQRFDQHVQRWLQQKTGRGLPGVRFEGGVPLYRYRLIGLDSREVDTSKCGCAHTLVYSPNIYAGGSECSLVPHAILHELGHTIGLCDEYDTCVYDQTDQYMREGFGHPCLNRRPDAANSDCGVKCCASGKACCDGVFADTKADGFYNIMGSGNVPPSRRMDTRTKGIYDAYFCKVLGVCG